MTSPKIKVCGITQLEQAAALSQIGVDYIGFNFIPSSKRYISPKNAKELSTSLKKTNTMTVGVFQNQEPELINRIIEEVNLDLVQLHGTEPPSTLGLIHIPTIKVFSIESSFDFNQLKDYDSQYFLFDRKVAQELGGTGLQFDWELLKNYEGSTPYFLAGGIGPENFNNATLTSAFALDINSKFEISPGIKDLELIKKSIKHIKA